MWHSHHIVADYERKGLYGRLVAQIYRHLTAE